MKKFGYKYQIEQALLAEKLVIKTIDASCECWDDEHWLIEYTYDSNISFILYFIVDPMFEGQKKDGQGICEVKASTKIIKSWNDDENTIASLWMSKRKFNEKLDEFIITICAFIKEELDNAIQEPIKS